MDKPLTTLKQNSNYEVIFRASFVDKSGKRIYAKNYGKKVFAIRVKKKKVNS